MEYILLVCEAKRAEGKREGEDRRGQQGAEGANVWFAPPLLSRPPVTSDLTGYT